MFKEVHVILEERFLHFIWQYQYFEKPLLGTDHEKIEVIFPGHPNTDAGPDFREAKLIIDGIRWVGSVEIHVKASEWLSHGHQNDEMYETTILHVVWDADVKVRRSDETLIPSFSLKNKVDPIVYDNYKKLIRSPGTIPCGSQIALADNLIKRATLDKVLTERLLKKSQKMIDFVERENGDWEEASFQMLALNFGFKLNADPFLRLSKSVSLKILTKYNLLQIEALLLGLAGFLDIVPQDHYQSQLLKEYHFLKHKHKLDASLAVHHWKFMRMRPANFPTIRIAQMSKFIHQVKHIFSLIIETADNKALYRHLMVSQSAYWTSHYHFSKVADTPIKKLGKQTAENVVMNTVVPILVAYGKSVDQQDLIDRAMNFLEQIRAEKNKITKMWESLGWPANSAFDSQALIQLNAAYCQKKRCTSCSIGMHLIKPRK